jgi:hypothetical protein
VTVSAASDPSRSSISTSTAALAIACLSNQLTMSDAIGGAFSRTNNGIGGA